MRWSSRRGNYLVIAALGLPVLLGFTAISIDMARITSAKTDLIQASDAAAHFALVSLRSGTQTDVIQEELMGFYPENQVAQKAVHARNMDLTPGFWDFESNEWTPYSWDTIGERPINAFAATAHRTGVTDGLPMLLTPFLGVNYVDIMSEKSSIAALRATEMMIVLDTTFSFGDEIEVAKDASLKLLELMREQDLPGSRIGMVTFTGAAELFTTFKDPSYQFDEIYARWSGDFSGEPVLPNTHCVPHFRPDGRRVLGSWECTGPQFDNTGNHGGTAADPVPILETTYYFKRGISLCNVRDLAHDPMGYDPHGRFFSQLDRWGHHLFLSEDMVPCGAGGGGTNQGSGLEVALDEMLLRGASGSHWEMMLITDGEPHRPDTSRHHTYPRWDNGGHPVSPDGIQSYTRQIAGEICEKDIDLHGIYYSNPAQPDVEAFLSSQVVCDKSTSTYSSTPYIDELQGLMEDVIASLPIVFVQ